MKELSIRDTRYYEMLLKNNYISDLTKVRSIWNEFWYVFDMFLSKLDVMTSLHRKC